MAKQTSSSAKQNSAAVSRVRREVETACSQTISLTPDEQLAFWTALSAPPKLTKRQKKLGAIMRGEP